MTREEFIKQLVKIDFIEDQQAYGFYPFHMITKNAEGITSMVALALNDVRDCYKQFVKYILEGATTIYMAVDFPAGFDLSTDMVCVHTYIKGNVSVLGIPYDNMTGEVFQHVEESYYLDLILMQFRSYLKAYNIIIT
jgi:hypothetical protein